MALIDRLFERRATEKSFVDNPREWLAEMFGGRSSAGVAVTATTAMKFGAVFACVRILAETIGSLPLPVYRRLAGGTKEKATEHPLYEVMHDRPNPEQTAMEFREMMQGHLTLRGNCYAQIVRTNGGRVLELWPIHPDRVRVRRAADGPLVYHVGPSLSAINNTAIGPTAGLQTRELAAEDVLHIRGLSADGVMGLSPIQVASEAIGLALAQQEFNARFFSNNASPNGILKTPHNLQPDTRKALKEGIDEQTRGLSRAHRFLLLEGGLEWTQIGLSMRDAQFIQGAQLSVRDIARIFRIQPHKIGDLERATFSNIEQQAIEFVTDSIRPWAVRWDQVTTTKLLTERERRAGFFVEMNLEGLLRGDFKSRMEGHSIAMQWGFTTANRVAATENWEPFGDDGDVRLVPLNMQRADQVGVTPPAEPEPDPAPEPAPPPDARVRRLEALAEDAIARAVRREVNAMRRAIEEHARSSPAWRAAVDEFYVRHAAYIAEVLHVDIERARGYAQHHRAAVLAEAAAAIDTWDRTAADELRELLGLQEAHA